jgi:hypothetical protein
VGEFGAIPVPPAHPVIKIKAIVKKAASTRERVFLVRLFDAISRIPNKPITCD